MELVSFNRASKLAATRRGALIRAGAFGALIALLILALFALGGLLASLVATRGQVWSPADSPSPGWLAPASATDSLGRKLHSDSGLYPIVAANESSPSWPHRLAARVVSRALASIPPLRNDVGALTTLMASALAISFLLSVVATARRRAVAEASHEAAITFRRQIHRQMYRLGESSLPAEGLGPVLTLFNREVNDVRDGLANRLIVNPQIPILAAGLAAFALGISWTATLFLVGLGLLAGLALRSLNRTASIASTMAMRESALQFCLLQEDFGLIRTVRVHGMENIDKQRFDEHLERYRDAEIRRAIHEPKLNPTATLTLASSIILAVGFLAATVVVKGLSPASAILMTVAVGMLIRQGFNWRNSRQVIAQADRSAEGIFTYLERRPELHQAGGASFLPPIRHRISFENVSLASRSGQTLLDGLTVEIQANQKTSIMAADEESKHAIACLIPRLIDPKVGRVRIDGIDLRDVTLESIRAQVSLVLQTDLVFSDTVMANIALGDPSYDMPRVIHAAKLAHAHHFIQDLPHGYDTPIGPMGEYLKPDQQYRIALARAYLHDPSILVIEEPETPLDDDIKSFVDDTVARLAPGRTLIMLPHRLSTIRTSDRVILLHNGRLETSGSPREVGQASKLYRHLQYLEFNQFAAEEMEPTHPVGS